MLKSVWIFVFSQSKVQYEYENERLADKSACSGVRADLKLCLLESECCQKVCIQKKKHH